MPVVPWHMPAYAVILLIFFCFVIVASIVHFFLWRRNKKRAAGTQGKQASPLATNETPTGGVKGKSPMCPGWCVSSYQMGSRWRS